MIAFVAEMMQRTSAVGNPLSEGDGAGATRPLVADERERASEGAALQSQEATTAPPPALSIEIKETVVPRQVTMPRDAARSELPTEGDLPMPAPPAPAPASPAEPAPVAQPAPSTAAVTAVSTNATPLTMPSPAGSHPVVDLLSDPQRGMPSWMALAAVVVGMFVVGAGLAFAGYKIVSAVGAGGKDTTVTHRPIAEDAGPIAVVDAGRAPIVDAGVATSIVVGADSGVAVTPSTDAGNIAAAVADAGTATADAGRAVAPKPIRLVVTATAPARIVWRTVDDARVGTGTTRLELKKGTQELIAYDAARQQRSTLSIAVDATNPLKGSVDYTPLLTATLIVKNAGGRQLLLGTEPIVEGQPVRAVPGRYNLQVLPNDQGRGRLPITLKSAETLTVDVAAAFKRSRAISARAPCRPARSTSRSRRLARSTRSSSRRRRRRSWSSSPGTR
jgi:hypothetical protein